VVIPGRHWGNRVGAIECITVLVCVSGMMLRIKFMADFCRHADKRDSDVPEVITKRRQQDAREETSRSPGYGNSGYRGKATARCQGQEKVKWSNSYNMYNVYVQALQWSSQAQSIP